MADKARKWTDKQLAEMEKRIERVYKEAERGIREKWDEYMTNAEKRLKTLQDAYDAAKASGDKSETEKALKALTKAKENITYRNKYYQDMVDDVTTRIANVNQIAVSYLNGELPSIYTANYNEAAVDASRVGMNFSIVNENTVRNLITQGEIKLPYKSIDKIKDKRWNAKQINSSVLQGILQGESMNKIADRLTPIMNNNEKAAIRNARTMVTGAECRGRLDSYKDLDERGAVQMKVWIATPDKRVRDSHLAVDGEEVELNDTFSNGLEFPGDTDGDPAEYYNCRCSMRTHIIGFRKADGSIVKIDYERQRTYHEEQIEKERRDRRDGK